MHIHSHYAQIINMCANFDIKNHNDILKTKSVSKMKEIFKKM